MKTYKISDVANVVLDKASNNTEMPYLEIGDIDVSTKQYCVKKKPAVEGALTAKKNHILISKVRPTRGAITILDDDYCVSNAFVVLEGNNTVFSKYLFYSIAYNDKFYRYLGRLEKGTSYPSCRASDILFFKIPVKQKIEQEKIVKILDQADALRQKRKEQLRLLDDYLKAIFLEMFGDPVRNSKGWDVVLLLKIANVVSGVTKGRKLNTKKTVCVPYMRVANVQDGHINLNEIKKINVLPSDVDKYRLLEDDVLLTEGGDPDKLGRGAVWKYNIPDCIHQNHIFRVRVNSKNIKPLFLSWLIGSEYGKRYFLRAAKQTTGIATINSTQLKAFPVQMASVILQNKFVSIVEQVEQTKQKMRESLDEMNNHFNALMQRYFG